MIDSVVATFAVEPIAALWDELLPLLARHWAEVAHYADIPLHIDQARYEDAERLGAFLVITARAEGRLVGYVAFHVAPNAHYRDSLQATQDVIYVEPDVRAAGLGSALVQYADALLRELGVQVVIQHVKRAHPALGRVLEQAGYEPMDVLYVKRLDLEPEES